ncbi:MAG: DUF3307 domain-containing protein [Victivallaceae bacterium]|nr:DUF3307 domain-containing protein [Victivallaceae bacterium]
MVFYHCGFNIFLILVTAHLTADFVLQTDGLVKWKRRNSGLLVHALIHAGVSWLFLWQWQACGLIALVFAVHFLLDRVKTALVGKHHNQVWFFLGDQAAHILSLWGILELNGRLLFFPVSPCGNLKLAIFLLLALFLLTTCFAGHVIGFITRDIISKNHLKIDGLENGGKLIGNLERALIFFLVLFNMPEVIGLIAAAKSILRFGEIKQNWKTAEYVLIGTLISFLTALVLGYLARAAVIRLMPALLR